MEQLDMVQPTHLKDIISNIWVIVLILNNLDTTLEFGFQYG